MTENLSDQTRDAKLIRSGLYLATCGLALIVLGAVVLYATRLDATVREHFGLSDFALEGIIGLSAIFCVVIIMIYAPIRYVQTRM